MIYEAETRMLTETIAPGVTPSEEELTALARMRGTRLQSGQAIECVAVVYIGGPGEAVEHFALLRRLGLQCRAIGDDGQEKVLLEGICEHLPVAKTIDPLYPFLREATWPHLATTPHRRLLDGIYQGPCVTYGWDRGESVKRVTQDDLGAYTIKEIEAQALANLRLQPFSPQVISAGIVVLMGEYCSEAVLLPEVMRACARTLECSLMLVAIPKGARLMAVRADDLTLANSLLHWTHKQYASNGRLISKDPLLVQANGAIVGLATQ